MQEEEELPEGCNIKISKASRGASRCSNCLTVKYLELKLQGDDGHGGRRIKSTDDCRLPLKLLGQIFSRAPQTFQTILEILSHSCIPMSQNSCRAVKFWDAASQCFSLIGGL